MSLMFFLHISSQMSKYMKQYFGHETFAQDHMKALVNVPMICVSSS